MGYLQIILMCLLWAIFVFNVLAFNAPLTIDEMQTMVGFLTLGAMGGILIHSIPLIFKLINEGKNQNAN